MAGPFSFSPNSFKIRSECQRGTALSGEKNNPRSKAKNQKIKAFSKNFSDYFQEQFISKNL